jgi:predicted transposase YbfD/YdcC
MSSTQHHATLGQLSKRFEQLPDPRDQRQPKHLLGDMLVIALCSALTGGRTFGDMQDYGIGHQPWLSTFLALPHGIPSHDTFNRLFAALDSHAMDSALLDWSSLCDIPPWDMTLPEHPVAQRHYAIDGKRQRGSRRSIQGTLKMDQTLNVWSTHNGIALAQRRIPLDGSEIEQMPLLLRHLHLKGAIITADAAHAQTHTVDTIIAGGGDYILTVKGNQPTTHEALQSALAPIIALTPEAHFESIEKGHGRLETRRCWVSSDLSDFAPRGQWKGLGSIAVIEVQREDLITGKLSIERRYIISSLAPLGSEAATAERLVRIARAHWSVENNLHWSLDVHWGEDQSRARSGNAATNLSALRKLAMNLLKAVPPPNPKSKHISMRSRHYIATITPNYLTALLEYFATDR